MTIRRLPEDFRVEERLTETYTHALAVGAGDDPAAAWRAVYQLRKTSMTTPEAVDRFAREIGGSKALAQRSGAKRGPNRDKPIVEYAGLKDKHASTVQHVAVAVRPGCGSADLPHELRGERWEAILTGFSPNALDSSAIDRNEFTIVVRDLTPDASNEMDRRAKLLTLPVSNPSSAPANLPQGRTLAIVNYFGAQRFGSARHGGGFIAARLIKGDFEGALKLAIGTPARKDIGKTRILSRLCAQQWGNWKEIKARAPRMPERAAIDVLASGGTFKDAFAALPMFTQTMCVEAYQSHLWNDAARRLVATIAAESGVTPIVSDDEFGPMHFPPAAALSTMRRVAWREVQMPLLSPQTELLPPWGEAASASLASEKIRVDELRIPGLRRPWFGEAARSLFVHAQGFELSKPEHDELSGKGGKGEKARRLKRTAHFALSRGAYATVVLRALGQ